MKASKQQQELELEQAIEQTIEQVDNQGTPISMAEWRTFHSNLSEAQLARYLVTNWTIPPDMASQLHRFFLRDYPADILDRLLKHNNGLLKDQNDLYVPIFNNTRRKDVRDGAHERYILSYRKLTDTCPYGYVIIQPKLY